MSEPKQVKVDNWGIYFLQRLKHFFNRTDYCDLTLQFQDNAQLKVHRLVLSACTEYFELLERTCEMYEDCLVMPDDLQADVVVPIVNFMYTGQLEFRMEILERLHATSEIMNMPVLTKLLDSHRPKIKHGQSYSKRQPKQSVSINLSTGEAVAAAPSTTSTMSAAAAPKRSFAKAFEKNMQNNVQKDKKSSQPTNKSATSLNITNGGLVYRPSSPVPLETLCKVKTQKFVASEPRPTRYELPEELDKDNIFENSFCNISYTSRPLMVHPETTKQYAKRPRQDKGQASTSKRSKGGTMDIVECKKLSREQEELLFEDSDSTMISDETEMFKPAYINPVNIKSESSRDPNKLFDQLLDQNEEQSAKVTIETTKNNKAGANLDHAKIISEVLKKYPHLVKSNKNIKLKIFNNPPPSKGPAKKQKASPALLMDKAQNNRNIELISDFTYETDVLDSKQAARLIAMGAENIEGPWICLICGTPGRALHFTSYYKFRRHLIDVHNEKPVLNICEHCGQRVTKRNHLLHHMYTKHGVDPPPSYHFPKCTQCNYVALTKALLVKHKLSHTENKSFRCNVCPAAFNSSNLLLAHIQSTGHKYIADRKHSHQCIYCLRVFIREDNLYAHLKTHHKVDAVKDGIIDESDEESNYETVKDVKHEPEQNEYDDNLMEYHIQQKPDGNIQLIQKKVASTTPSKQKILNSGLSSETPKAPRRSKPTKVVHNIRTEHDHDEATYNDNTEEIVVIDNNEYIMSGNRLILRKPTKQPAEEYILSDMVEEKSGASTPQKMESTTSIDYATILNSNENIQEANIILENLPESIPVYVSNEEEYKALMSSNHNIIFDSNDANKTLTVLTTPDSATLETASLNLDNTHNNDMMIIHEEYPLNVSQAVTTDNSNIVVVYSQQVDDPSKEYQLLTTQALGPQYSQSSAVLTQSFETVSTSSPVMTAHILESQEATWQGDIHQSIDTQHTETSAVIQSIVHADAIPTESAPEPIEEEEDMNSLPQVQLIPNTTEPAHFNQTESINSEPLVEPELMQTTPNMTMEIEVPLVANTEEKIENFGPIETIPENRDDQPDVVEKQSDSEISQKIKLVSVTENLSKIEAPPEMISDDVHSSDTNEAIISLDIQSDAGENATSMDVPNSDTNENNIVSMNIPTSDTVEKQTNIQEPITNINNEVSQSEEEPVGPENELCATAAEQLKDLSAEWSEENAETPSQDSVDEADIQEHIDPEANSAEVEESVENIQQELINQIQITPHEDGCSTEHDSPEPEEKSTTSQAVVPHVKISSLLTDWDDNEDFQEANDANESVSVPTEEAPEIQNPDVVPDSEKVLVTNKIDSSETAENDTETAAAPDDEVIENTPDQETNNEPSDEVDGTKQDNIKSLVSDWDDDEDEKE